MYNGTIHDTVITPRVPTSVRLDKQADLNELSHQMKLNIAQLKSLLGIKSKDGDYEFGSMEDLSFFGKSFNSVLDHKEEELRLLQNDISKLHTLYLKKQSYPSPRRSLSSPSTPRKSSTSLMLERSNSIGIPSQTSAFSPRISTSSLPGKDLRQRELEFDMSLRRFSRETDSAFTRSTERLNRDYGLRRKSSSSQSSSLKSSPRNLRNHDSNPSFSQSSSSNKRKSSARSITDLAENSTSSSKRNQSPSSARTPRSSNEARIIKVKPKTKPHDVASRNSNNNNSSHLRSKRATSNTSEVHKPRPRKHSSGHKSITSTYVDTSSNDDISSSEYDESLLSSDIEETRTEGSQRSRGSRKSQQQQLKMKKKIEQDALIKFQEVERRLSVLQQRCDLLENENKNIKKDQNARNNKKIVDLKHQNSELVNVARRLEQKAKALQLENNKKSRESVGGTQDLIQQKKAFAKLKSRMETEHSRTITEKEHQIDSLKKQVDDLKKALRQANNFKFSQQGTDDALTSSLKQVQKESLQLQKLAAAGNKKVTIRSLSMPVTARQKILEESNRNLRRQLSQLEEKYRQACNGTSTDDLKLELDEYKEKYESLERVSKEARINTVNLESQLQIAKVESSDTNFRLTELKNSFGQLEAEYNTVHEQLSVAIKERDAAINQCKENSIKISEMELCIKNMDNHIGGGDNGKWAKMNSRAATQYQIALEKLQAKVAELEKQCHEQNETNRLLNEQLIKLMKSSTQTSPVDQEEKDITREVETDILQPFTQVPKLPTFTTEHETSALPVPSTKINVNVVNSDPDEYRNRGNQQHPTRKNVQPHVGGNEDTEIEDFLEEDFVQTMDNNDGGKLRVYIAKYTYNPYEGPNDSPEAELPLVAGDYVYVYGAMDEDGFFEGELMNGRRGLVPSNFLEPVHDEGHNNMMNGKSKADNSGSARCTSSEISQSESIISSCTSIGSSRLSQRGDVSDSNAPVQIHGVLPYPKKLRIDKQLSHSLIIGWISPQLNEDETIDEYHVFVNSEFRTAVSGKKQKAVVENIRHEQPCRISVCAVSQWGISDENLCVLSHGRGADLAPTSVRMEKVGASSARVAWTPSSSRQCHIVTVEEEGTERFSPRLKNPTHMTHTVSPPAYRFTFGNLRPNIQYKVVVNVKGSTDEPRSFTRFRTPEAGPPDPPLSVQIEECQNSNYLLITWLPVTLNTLGTSNGVVVKGYGIHVGDTKVCEVQSPTIDQCTIRTQTLADAFSKQLSTGPDLTFYRLSKPSKSVLRWNKHVPPSITIKTYAVNGQESDHSDPCIITQELYNQLMELIKENANLSSPKPSEQSKIRMRPPLMRSVESTDLDVSFSSDISIPGLSTPRSKTRDGVRDNRQSVASSVGSGNRTSHGSKTNIFQQTRVVPSIEITHDTSSDEDPTAVNGLGSRSSSTKSLNKKQSDSKTNTSKNDATENHKSSYKTSDNDDAVSVSSSHTSSSAGGDGTKHKKSNSVANRAARAIQAHKLQRGESAEYSNPEDYMPSNAIGSRKNLNPSDTEKRSTVRHQSPEHIRKQQHRHHHHHHNMRHTGKRPHSVTSDEHSQGSHHSRSSSRHGHGYFHHGRPTNNRRDIIRQSTMSSQSGSELASEVEPQYPVDKSRVTLYVALYSYDPQMMSPNTDTFDEELSFTEGQLIKVFGTKDEDGFYYGETHTGNLGYIPCNMVSEVEVENMQMLNDLYERGHLPSASPDEDEQSTSEAKTKSGASQAPNGSDEPDSGGKPKGKTRYFVAIFDYDPTHLSPNIDVDVEISFSRDDVITVEGEMDDDGFYRGRLRGKEGLVPSNFLEEITEEQANSLRQKAESKPEKKSLVETNTNSILSPVPKPIPRPNHNNTPNLRSASSLPSSYHTTSNNVNPNRVDNAVSQRKKGGFISKGKKLFKKLGGSQDGKRR